MWGVSICSSAAFSPKMLTRSVGNEGASSKSSARSNQTCFYIRPKGGHSVPGLCGEGGVPLACMGVPPLHVLLLESHYQG